MTCARTLSGWHVYRPRPVVMIDADPEVPYRPTTHPRTCLCGTLPTEADVMRIEAMRLRAIEIDPGNALRYAPL